MIKLKEGDLADFRVVLANPAKREFKKLPRHAQVRVAEVLTGLKSNPRPIGADKLQSSPSFYRVGTGDYRVIYSIKTDLAAVIVVVIRHRKDAYKGLEDLDKKLAAVLVRVADSILDSARVEGTA